MGGKLCWVLRHVFGSLGKKELERRELEVGDVDGVSERAGEGLVNGRDTPGTTPVGAKATLGIHEPREGRPSPFILTRDSAVLVSVLASKGI